LGCMAPPKERCSCQSNHFKSSGDALPLKQGHGSPGIWIEYAGNMNVNWCNYSEIWLSNKNIGKWGMK
jgi:hypothetical protein